EASSLPSGDQATDLTSFTEVTSLKGLSSVCSSVCSNSPVTELHSRTVPSAAPEANTLPSGDQLADQTPRLWPLSVCSNSPVTGFHNRTVPSEAPEANSSPLGDQPTAQTLFVWPFKVWSNVRPGNEVMEFRAVDASCIASIEGIRVGS